MHRFARLSRFIWCGRVGVLFLCCYALATCGGSAAVPSPPHEAVTAENAPTRMDGRATVPATESAITVLQKPTASNVPQSPTGAPDREPASPSGLFVAESPDGLVLVQIPGMSRTPLNYNGRSPSWSPDGEWIAFLADPQNLSLGSTNGCASENDQVFVIRRNGSELEQITSRPGRKEQPDWSPDMKRLVYSADDVEGKWGVFVVARDGTQDSLLADDGAHPDWSPDGSRIAFSRGFQMCIVSASGGSPECWEIRGNGCDYARSEDNLTGICERGQEAELSNFLAIAYPAWSPDGQWLAFGNPADWDPDLPGIWLVRPDGTDLRRLTPLDVTRPAWSPDGKWIAFSEHYGDCGQGGIGFIDRDGKQLIPTAASGNDPSWSPLTTDIPPADSVPDGWIVIGDGLAGSGQVCTMRLSGLLADATCIYDFPGDEYNRGFAISADASWIAFSGGAGGIEDLYVFRKDGSELRKLTPGMSPAWSPDGEQIAYITDLAEDGMGISLVRPDGSDQRIVLSGLTDIGSGLFWAPDGKWIGFGRGFGTPEYGLYAVSITGGKVAPLIRGDAQNGAWSPDGEWIAFECRLGDRAYTEICVARKDGTDRRRLTYRPEGRTGSSQEPCWSSDGQWIVFSREYYESEAESGVYLMRPDGSELRSLNMSGAEFSCSQ